MAACDFCELAELGCDCYDLSAKIFDTWAACVYESPEEYREAIKDKTLPIKW